MTGPLTVTGGSTVVKLPNTCGTTDDGFDPPRTLSLTLTATDVTAVVVGEGRLGESGASTASPPGAPKPSARSWATGGRRRQRAHRPGTT